MRRPTIAEIKVAVADHFEVKVSDLTGPSRDRVFVEPRQIAYAICAIGNVNTESGIARAFGGRHPTTVRDGLARVQSKGRKWSDHIDAIMEALTAQPVFTSTRTAQGETE